MTTTKPEKRANRRLPPASQKYGEYNILSAVPLALVTGGKGHRP
jgi:hypothetical protein